MPIKLNTSQTYKPSFNFKARNNIIKTADNLSRRVKSEFPVYSNTKLNSFKTCSSTVETSNFKEAVSDLVNFLRYNYRKNSDDIDIIKMLDLMKKTKAANCEEIAQLSCVAAKMNGSQNARSFYVYAYDPKRHTITDLDHTIAALNFPIPRRYRFFDGDTDEKIELRHLLKPDNNTILIDSWAGIADYAKSAVARYKEDVPLSIPALLEDNIRFLPLDEIELSEKEIKYLKFKYSGLLLKNHSMNIDKETVNAFENETSNISYRDEIIAIKKRYGLKSVQREAEKIKEIESVRLKKDFGQRVCEFIDKFKKLF